MKRNPSLKARLNVLGNEIEKQIDRIERGDNSELLQIECLFYDLK